MKLILSDRTLALPECGSDVEWIDLSKLDIANCVGCFGCWTKTPGKCVIRDDAVRVYPRIAESSQVMYISRIRYGGYDTPMKTMLERAIPIQQAFIRLVEGRLTTFSAGWFPSGRLSSATGRGLTRSGRCSAGWWRAMPGT